jgi:hypothetical protein
VIATFASLLIAAAQPAAPPPIIAPAPSVPCHSATVEEVEAAPDRFSDRCVVVSGLGGRLRLFGSVESYYRFGVAAKGGHVGLVGIDGPAGRLRGEPIFLTVVGYVSTCRKLGDMLRQAGHPDRLPTYCLFGLDPVIVVTDQTADPTRHAERLVGEENRRIHGTLELAPSDWPLRPKLLRAAKEFGKAIAAGNVAALKSMHGEKAGSDRELLPYLLQRTDSPFAELRRRRPRQIAILLRTSPAFRETSRRDGFAFLCFCRTADCTALWPISFEDAENRPDRPYACTYYDPTEIAPFSTFIGPGFLPEPEASAFHRPSESSRQ